jgi:hypothetical protein
MRADVALYAAKSEGRNRRRERSSLVPAGDSGAHSIRLDARFDRAGHGRAARAAAGR